MREHSSTSKTKDEIISRKKKTLKIHFIRLSKCVHGVPFVRG